MIVIELEFLQVSFDLNLKLKINYYFKKIDCTTLINDVRFLEIMNILNVYKTNIDEI